jgi:integrase
LAACSCIHTGIASQLGHEDAEMVFRVYSAWVKEFDGEQVNMLNEKLGFAPNVPQNGILINNI